ncbi:porin family protein [Spirosoma sp. KNUC1025]|uniref:porin family protein n=1 Tax=Spirosoma sp. KNUC1025 TaxID=2894082 RepID=UPI00386D46E5|nr:PorT family protein [Spirosoma sp. KNUC1025]
MNSIKSFCPLLMMLVLAVGGSFAQSSSTTATQPMSTTSTNRMQDLYDQYHGVSKKPATTTSTPTSAPAAVSTPAPPARRASEYNNPQPVATSRPKSADADANMSGVRVGIRGGITNTFFTEEQSLIKSDIGYVGGLTFNFGAGTFSFQPEVNYARYGLKVNDDFTGVSVKGAADVIEVPLLLKLSTGTYAGHRFFINIGPYGSYLAGVSANGKKVPIDDSISRFGFGAAAGIGVALKAGPGHVTLEGRGLYSFGDTQDGFSTDSRAIRSQLTVGYVFPLGSR